MPHSLDDATALARKLVAFGRAAAWLRLCGVAVSGRPTMYGRRPIIRRRGGTICVGHAFQVVGRQFPAALSTGPGGRLVFGTNVFVNQGVNVHAEASVRIGDNVRLADLAAIYDTDFHELEPGSGQRAAEVVIEDNVWIGRGAIVLKGVRVGRNSVVGAGAVVTSSVPPDSLAAGNPARVVRSLRSAEGWVREA